MAYSVVSAIPADIEISSLPPLLDVDDAADLVDLDTLPALPETTHEEADELAKISQQPSELGDVWDLPYPPFPVYADYCGQIRHYSYHGGISLSCVTTRRQVHCSLEHYYCLQKHLDVNLILLRQYGEEGLATRIYLADRKASSQSPLEVAQSSFAIHHIGISEALKNQSLGLPSYYDFHQSRNFFAHDFGTPKGMLDPYRNLATEVEGKTALYEPLMNLVKTNIKMLEEQLADEDIWFKPEPVPPRPLTPFFSWGGMVYEHQAQDEPRKVSEEEDEEEEHIDSDPSPGCFTTSFRYLFFRSNFIRKLSKRVEDTVKIVNLEFETSNIEFAAGDEGYSSQETEAEEVARVEPEDSTVEYTW